MSFTWFEFILIGLAVFRLTHLFLYDKITESLRLVFLYEEKVINGEEDIEWHYVTKGFGVKKFIGELFICHWCMSVWLSGMVIAGYLIFPQVFIVIIYIFSIAALAVILEEFVLRFF